MNVLASKPAKRQPAEGPPAFNCVLHDSSAKCLRNVAAVLDTLPRLQGDRGSCNIALHVVETAEKQAGKHLVFDGTARQCFWPATPVSGQSCKGSGGVKVWGLIDSPRP